MTPTSFTDCTNPMLSMPVQTGLAVDFAGDVKLSRHHPSMIMQRLAQGGIMGTRRSGNGGNCTIDARRCRQARLRQMAAA